MATEISCPACRKKIVVEIVSAPQPMELECPRCQTDLSRLAMVQCAAERHLLEARRCLQEEDWKQAFRLATYSWQLCHKTGAARVALFAAVGQGEPHTILAWLYINRRLH